MNHLKKLILAAAFGLMLLPLTSHARTGYVYSISVNGRALNTTGPAFSKNGTMILFDPITTVGTRNGINNLDVALTTGSPYAYPPSAGALNFMTNSKLATLFGYSASGFVQSALDLVYTSWGSNCLTLQPDSTIAAALYKSSPNVFLASSSLTAQFYYAQSGAFKICTSDSFNTFSGTISLNGTSFYSSITPAVTYQATLTARFVGTYDFAV